MKRYSRTLVAVAIGLMLSCCKKKNDLPPLAPGMFTFNLDGGPTDTLYGGIDTTSVYGYSVFTASGQPSGFYTTLDLQIQLYYPTYTLKGTYLDNAWATGPIYGGGNGLTCQLYEPNPGVYDYSFQDNPALQVFSLHIISHIGNNIQATFSGRLFAAYAASSTTWTYTDLTNGRLNVNY